ncbi:hypothetical protein AVEN_260651-1, partial [Araneus ventricosus]
MAGCHFASLHHPASISPHNPTSLSVLSSARGRGVKYLDFYVAYPGRVVMIPGEDLREKTTSVEDCAKFCREEKKFICRGFEYCRSTKTCVLHSKHVMDLKQGEFIDSKKKSTCTHYA